MRCHLQTPPRRMAGQPSADRPWRVAAASAVGTSHLATGAPCQDAHAWRLVTGPAGPVAAAVVSDGAGTAARSADGARLACDSFIEMVEAVVAGDGVAALDRERVHAWIGEFQASIQRLAAEAGTRPRDYACTLVGAVIGLNWSVFVQVGDGSIVVRSAGDPDYGWVFWPEAGEYANTTFFITEDRAIEHVQFEGAPLRYAEVALFTDGLQRMVLHLGDRTVHQPFFTSMFRVLEGDSVPSDGLLSERLHAYLGSDVVNARTDDDKTLVLMRRTDGGGV